MEGCEEPVFSLCDCRNKQQLVLCILCTLVFQGKKRRKENTLTVCCG